MTAMQYLKIHVAKKIKLDMYQTKEALNTILIDGFICLRLAMKFCDSQIDHYQPLNSESSTTSVSDADDSTKVDISDENAFQNIIDLIIH